MTKHNIPVRERILQLLAEKPHSRTELHKRLHCKSVETTDVLAALDLEGIIESETFAPRHVKGGNFGRRRRVWSLRTPPVQAPVPSDSVPANG